MSSEIMTNMSEDIMRPKQLPDNLQAEFVSVFMGGSGTSWRLRVEKLDFWP